MGSYSQAAILLKIAHLFIYFFFNAQKEELYKCKKRADNNAPTQHVSALSAHN